MVLFLILIACMASLAIFLILNKKAVAVEREGVVKEVLNKDAFVVQFDDARPTMLGRRSFDFTVSRWPRKTRCWMTRFSSF